MTRRHIILALKLLLAAGVIVWLFESDRIDFRDLARVGERWPWFVAAQVPFGIVLFLCAFRWRLLLHAQGIHYSLRDAFSLTMIGQLFNQLVIGTTGGDMVKAYTVAVEHPGLRGAGILSVFLDRAVGLFVLIGVALVAIAFNYELILSRPKDLMPLASVVVIAFFGSIIAGYIFYSERVRSLAAVKWIIARLPFHATLRKLSAAVYVYKFHPREVALAIVSSIVVQVCMVILNLCLAHALVGPGVPWTTFFFLIPLAHLAMAVPVNPPGAIGTAEAIYGYLLQLGGLLKSQGAMICILQRITYYLWALAGCAFYLHRRSKVIRAVEAAREADAGGPGEDDPAVRAGENEGSLVECSPRD